MSLKKFIAWMTVITAAIVFLMYPLNYYIMSPGKAYGLTDYVKVDHADTKSDGTLNMMTIALSPATPFRYIRAKFSDEQDIMREDEVHAPEESDAEYNKRQLKLMSDSQFNAKYMAYKTTGNEYKVNYNGVYVIYVVEKSAAEGILQSGDEVTSIDGKEIIKHQQLVDYLSKKIKGDEVTLAITRDDKKLKKSVKLAEIPGGKGRIGLGITFTDSKSITTKPEVKIDSEKIGGPSAGMMFTLEMIDQLTKGDLTKGYNIAGTGEMLENGQVGRIGGIDKKVMAAHKQGMDIFFAPDDEISPELKKAVPDMVPNYDEAKKTAEKIGTKMKIVPVKTLDDALGYLKELPEK
ncbi:SepM family pheromone-processing serine protease [Kurthia zopfii]|uniref:SepM family pheromone-processing serine protease n=1 Tax=Kurthia zopfii TaxID=1650 RepID=UPI000F6FDAE0|nr:SepM family pheromone-processing serine protease [Kurthia zopfii]VEI04802.1 DNA-binding ATP-dependent protease La [Kurthia zopfii]